jgi:ABC-2 type transport system ATP-binding protein
MEHPTPPDDADEAAAAAVRTDGLTKRYGDALAVDDLDLTVDRGTVYGFLGPNGAGKTTTMRMLVSLTEPTAGEAWVAGVPVTDRDGLVDRIGYLPEEPPLFEELTGREQLEYVTALRDLPRETARDRIDRLAGRLDLRADLDQRISQYSTGMRQKTAIVAALAHDPDVVFMDEPTSGLDPRAARTVREAIVDLAADDAAVFLSTHVLPVVEAVADRVGVLHRGRLVAEGAPADLVARVDRPSDAGDGRVGTDATGGDITLEDAFLAVTTDAPSAAGGVGDGEAEADGEGHGDADGHPDPATGDGTAAGPAAERGE